MKSYDVPYPKLSVPYVTASGLYSGSVSPWAPGTIGSAVAAICGIFFLSGGSLFLGSLIWFFAGWWSIHAIEKTCGAKYHDARVFVADEWCGQWLVLAAMFYLFPKMPLWQIGCIGFLVFRAFDIIKPWPISAIDAKVSGGFGVMLDDVIAALMGIALLLAIAQFN